MTDNEKIIIESAVESALAFGLGIMTNVSEQLAMDDIEMTDEMEEYAFSFAKEQEAI